MNETTTLLQEQQKLIDRQQKLITELLALVKDTSQGLKVILDWSGNEHLAENAKSNQQS